MYRLVVYDFNPGIRSLLRVPAETRAQGQESLLQTGEYIYGRNVAYKIIPLPQHLYLPIMSTSNGESLAQESPYNYVPSEAVAIVMIVLYSISTRKARTDCLTHSAR